MAKRARTSKRPGRARRAAAVLAGLLVAAVAVGGVVELRGVHANRDVSFPTGQSTGLSVSVASNG
jgi:hypothetical protein